MQLNFPQRPKPSMPDSDCWGLSSRARVKYCNLWYNASADAYSLSLKPQTPEQKVMLRIITCPGQYLKFRVYGSNP